MNDTYKVDARRLQAAVAQILIGKGVPAEDAAVVADSLVDADLTNVQSHGVQRVKFYTNGIDKGGMNPVCDLQPLTDSASCASYDAQCALGIVAAYKAMKIAIEKARETGIGLVTVRNSNHCSRVAYFIRMATEQNMLGIACSNAPKSMPPWGSREKYFGTNPFALGAPTHGDPVIVDMATSVVARGKIILADKKGASIPEGWAIDVDGNPTTDAAKALEGCVLPFGGAKGSGIALMVDVFSGILAGAAFGGHIGNPFAHPENCMNCGHALMAVDITRFQDLEEFKDKMEQFRTEIKGLKRANGVNEILLPGENSSNNRRKNLANGIDLPVAVYGELEELSRELQLPFDIRLEA
ncbi:MAG: Ldh family oxidoreductase [Oscillospiraceae bacterium]|nr:Ldh family oxidoreductase [Oscillospiraceae bacterium]